jgi:hypothetical protein
MSDVITGDKLKEGLAHALYPWIADPSVRLVWPCRIVYAICAIVAAFGHKECPMVSEIIGIQIFFTSLMGMNTKSRYSLKSPLLRKSASAVIGLALSTIVTLSFFCFEGAAQLVTFTIKGVIQPTYVSYLSPFIFLLLASTWFLVAKMQNVTESLAD